MLYDKYMNLNALRMLLNYIKTMKEKQRVVHTEYNLFEMKLDKQDETKWIC